MTAVVRPSLKLLTCGKITMVDDSCGTSVSMVE